MDAPYLVTLPAMYTDLQTGALLEPAELTAEQWTTLGDGHSELGRVLLDEFGVRQMFHPHADAHVDDDARTDRFLELTDPATVSLCLDTGPHRLRRRRQPGHRARHPDRIGYVHLKSVDPDVLARSAPRAVVRPGRAARAPWSNPTAANRTCRRCSPSSMPSASR